MPVVPLGMLYLTSDGFASESTFLIADGTNPAAPSQVAVYSLNTGVFAQDQLGPSNVVFKADHVFILSSEGFTTGKKRYIASYDVSNPLVVTQTNALLLQTVTNVGSIAASGAPYMVLGGTVAWCLTQGRTNVEAGRLIAVDVSDPANLSVLSDNPAAGITDAPRVMFLLGTSLYIASSSSGSQKLFCYDVSDPTAPTLSSTLFLTQPGIGNPIAGLFVKDNVAYMITGTGTEGSKHFVLYDTGGMFLSVQNVNNVGGRAIIGL